MLWLCVLSKPHVAFILGVVLDSEVVVIPGPNKAFEQLGNADPKIVAHSKWYQPLLLLLQTLQARRLDRAAHLVRFHKGERWEDV